MQIQLDAVNGHFLEHMQGRIAASEIVHLNLKAQLPEPVCVADQQIRVFCKRGFRNLDSKLIGRNVILLNQAAKLSRNVPVFPDVTTRYIHRHETADALLVPAMQVLTNSVPHKAIQIINKSGFLQYGNKIRRI